MKTVVDIPDALLRRARKIAVARRKKFNDLVVEGLTDALSSGARGSNGRKHVTRESAEAAWLAGWRRLAQKNKVSELMSAAKVVSAMRR